ncbi:MAG: hypothetical protein P8Y25_11445 [Chromatiaceae bacterium]
MLVLGLALGAVQFVPLYEVVSTSFRGGEAAASLQDVLDWATNVGYPGYANAAVDEVFSTWAISTMFARAATGTMSPQDAIRAAEKDCRSIFDKWRARGMV